MPSKPKGNSTIFILILAWFGLQYLPGMSLVQPDRSEVVAWAVAEFVTVALLFLGVSLKRLEAEKVFALRTRADKRLFRLLGIWLGACAISAVLGIVRGNPWDYLAGDFYRFGALSVILALLYFSIQTPKNVQNLMRGFVLVYGFMVLVDLVRFNAFLAEEQERLTTETAHQAGMIAAAAIYLMLFDPERWVRRSSAGVLFLTMGLLFRAQMLTPLITLFLAMALFFCLNRKFAVFVGCGAAAAILVAASFYSESVSAEVPAYIAQKFSTAQQSLGPLESLEALSGVRLGETISIWEQLTSRPASLPFGTGEGSWLAPDPIPDPSLPISRYSLDKHYVHAGLLDALYHNGIIAIGAFFFLLWRVFRRARRLYAGGNPFGLFVMVTLMVTVLLLSYDMPFESAYPMLGLCFGGISIMEAARTNRSKVGSNQPDRA